jgi:hypothetical protein
MVSFAPRAMSSAPAHASFAAVLVSLAAVQMWSARLHDRVETFVAH